MSGKKEKPPKKPNTKPPQEKGGQQQKSRPPKPQKVDASEDVKREQKLQAILLADSFTKKFRPITCEGPKVLLPLVNVPMLEYTLEFLAQNGVEEVDLSKYQHHFLLLIRLLILLDFYILCLACINASRLY